MASMADMPFTFMGLDVHKDSTSAGILEPGVEQRWERFRSAG